MAAENLYRGKDAELVNEPWRLASAWHVFQDAHLHFPLHLNTMLAYPEAEGELVW